MLRIPAALELHSAEYKRGCERVPETRDGVSKVGLMRLCLPLEEKGDDSRRTCLFSGRMKVVGDERFFFPLKEGMYLVMDE